MSSLVKKQAPLLNLLITAKPFLRKDILKGASNNLILSIIECAYNILKGRVNLTEKQKKKLLNYKGVLRNIVKKRHTKNKHKLVVDQCGGSFLPALLLPVLTTILSKYIK